MAAREDLFENAGIRPEGVIRNVNVDYNAELGRGSDATVYGGTWRAPQANVAVKVLHPILTEPQAGGREVFLRKYGNECNRLQNLRHDNVVKFMGVTRSREGTPALVTERMDTTLRDCSQTTELSLLEQLDILCDASAGLAYLHSRGVVHRDLTTRNVLLSASPNRRAKLADVGLSRSLHGNWWFLNYGAALTRCPGTMSYMPPEALVERPAYDERLDSFSFGVLMTAVILRRDPSTAVLHAARERFLPDGRSEVIPEVERRASDMKAIGADHPLLDLIKRCLENDPERRPSAKTIHENLHGIRTRLFPNAQRKPESYHCLDCERSNQEVLRLNIEVASVWSRLDQMQASVLTVAQKESNIQELRAQLTEAEETVTTMREHQQELQARLTEAEGAVTTMRDHEQVLSAQLREAEETVTTMRDHEQDLQAQVRAAEETFMRMSRQEEELRVQLTEAEETVTMMRGNEQDLRSRLTETENTLTTTRDHEQALQVRLSEAQDILELTRQEAARAQEADSRAHSLEEQIREERERSACDRELLTVQAEQKLSEMEKMNSALFLQRVYQYNLELEQAKKSWLPLKVKSPFGEDYLAHLLIVLLAVWPMHYKQYICTTSHTAFLLLLLPLICIVLAGKFRLYETTI